MHIMKPFNSYHVFYNDKSFTAHILELFSKLYISVSMLYVMHSYKGKKKKLLKYTNSSSHNVIIIIIINVYRKK